MFEIPLQDKLSEYRRAEMMHQAKEAHRAQLLEAANKNQTSTRKPVLARVGKVLSTMGDNLQERYGLLEEQAAQQNKHQLPA